MRKIISVLTATRAEYGLLSPVIHKLLDCNSFDVRVVATGAHLSPEYGLTYREIEGDGVKIDKKIEILLSADSSMAVSKCMGLAMISFADYFEELKPDALLVLGDRYETLAVCCVAMNAGIPIFHLYGGETTEGAIDEAIRHAISKMSFLHFTSTEIYRKRVIQLGEHPDRVFNVGGLGIENAIKMKLLSKDKLEKSLNFALDKPYGVVTFHPTTLETGNAEEQMNELLKALDCYKDMKFIITKANADAEGRMINSILDRYVENKENVICCESLGVKRYLSALKYAEMVIGNSSSGLLEAPFFKIPTINIGNRQRGRIQAKSVINCEPLEEKICKAISLACSKEFRDRLMDMDNPYGNGETSEKIVRIIKKHFENANIKIEKSFYDL